MEKQVSAALLTIAVFCSAIIYGVWVNKSSDYQDDITKLEEKIALLEARDPEVKEVIVDEPLVPFKPSTILTVQQEALCTKLAVYGETRNSSPEEAELIMWVVINRALDTRRDTQYRGTSCGVVRAKNGLQFEGAKSFTVIDDIVWGVGLDYIPKGARKPNSADSIAWKNISNLVDDAYEGKLSRKTMATHFLNLQQIKGELKSWVKALKPVGVSSNHILFIDYEFVNGERVFFTREKPFKVSFNWSEHEKGQEES